MAPTAAALLAAWEAGAVRDPVERAPSLLLSLGALPQDEAIGEMTVGQCDARLFELRRAMFGEPFEGVATCPSCHTEVELSLSLADLQPPVTNAAPADVKLERDDYTVAFRIPRNLDLQAVVATGQEPQINDLVKRCVLHARGPDGQALSVDQLPEQIVRSVVEMMAKHDPGAHTTVGIRCPCGQAWVDEVDIRSVLWTDLTDWAGRTLNEVQLLARTYGWSEREILAMGAWRRRWYAEAAGW